jgi:hypothetical protein
MNGSFEIRPSMATMARLHNLPVYFKPNVVFVPYMNSETNVLVTSVTSGFLPPPKNFSMPKSNIPDFQSTDEKTKSNIPDFDHEGKKVKGTVKPLPPELAEFARENISLIRCALEVYQRGGELVEERFAQYFDVETIDDHSFNKEV